jgi:hypothetical protein
MELTVAVLAGYVIFFTLAFLFRPWRIISTVFDIFSSRSHSKLGRYLRGLFTDAARAKGSRA